MQPAAMQESKARPKEEAGKKKRKKWGGGGNQGDHSLKPLIYFFQMALFFLFRFFFPAES